MVAQRVYRSLVFDNGNMTQLTASGKWGGKHHSNENLFSRYNIRPYDAQICERLFPNQFPPAPQLWLTLLYDLPLEVLL